jgi:hypothetical protein
MGVPSPFWDQGSSLGANGSERGLPQGSGELSWPGAAWDAENEARPDLRARSCWPQALGEVVPGQSLGS